MTLCKSKSFFILGEKGPKSISLKREKKMFNFLHRSIFFKERNSKEDFVIAKILQLNQTPFNKEFNGTADLVGLLDFISVLKRGGGQKITLYDLVWLRVSGTPSSINPSHPLTVPHDASATQICPHRLSSLLVSVVLSLFDRIFLPLANLQHFFFWAYPVDMLSMMWLSGD